ncbi:hypothetical protein SPHINGOAX6_20247 [Sphingomonas sp. AX6]|nr:hypothetical protein SPHINGOAX6_20247 [Sphingomonas sp. AX6]
MRGYMRDAGPGLTALAITLHTHPVRAELVEALSFFMPRRTALRSAASRLVSANGA